MKIWRNHIGLTIAWLVFTTIASAEDQESIQTFLQTHCSQCHQGDEAEANFTIDSLDSLNSEKQPSTASWEKLLRRIQSRQMPPRDATRPTEHEYDEAIESIAQALDKVADRFPAVASTPSIRRLTRTEYGNAVRDLLAIEFEADELLPPDQISHGFDNITVHDLSPTLINRYLNAAQNASRLAIGASLKNPFAATIRVPGDVTQEEHIQGLPLGTRGGVLKSLQFPASGRYQLQVKLARDRDEVIEGLNATHELDVLIDREKKHRFTISPPDNPDDFTLVDANLIAQFDIAAGTHDLGVTFVDQSNSLLEIKREPFDASFNRHRHPRQNPAIFEVSIVGPLEKTDKPASSQSASHLRIFGDGFTVPTEQTVALKSAESILGLLMKFAYRRKIEQADLEQPMKFFREVYASSDFETGIEAAITSVLVNPNFLFRIEQSEQNRESSKENQHRDVELASRLSFFLWSSLPDEDLLDLAIAVQLSKPKTLKAQVARMLADDRAKSLATNFASQWLYLRNLESIQPDMRLFPDYDRNLSEALQQETELLFTSMMQENRPVTDLLFSRQTFLNERLAKHYGIDGVIGSHFRRVALDNDSHRGGLLRHGSVLTVTSYATRTSPTIRGNWILQNILGTPTPPPPPNIPALKEKEQAIGLTVRERLAVHRENEACAVCHNIMDPIGFALENYDATGRWRTFEGESKIDTQADLPDGTSIIGIEDLERSILERPELFVTTLTEKLMTYALGRGLEPTDGPHIRRIVKESQEDSYRFGRLIEAIVASKPFAREILN
jgi:hypothetical protein